MSESEIIDIVVSDSDMSDPVVSTELWEYWELEEWDVSDIVPHQEDLENAVFRLKKELKEEDWEKLFDSEYVKEHFADKEKESYLFDCKEVDEIKKKIISHFA